MTSNNFKISLKPLLYVYLFFACISYNLDWFYIAGSFGYIDILLPLIFLISLKQRYLKIDYLFICLVLLALISCISLINAISILGLDNVNIGYLLRSIYFAFLYFLFFNSDLNIESVLRVIMLSFIFSLALCIAVWLTSPRYFGFTSLPMLHVLDSPLGIMVNRNESGLIASLLYTLSLYGLLNKKIFPSLVNLVVVILSCLTVALSFSKGAWALAVIGTFFIMLYRYKTSRVLIVSILIIFLIPFLPLSDFIFADAVITRFTGSSETNAYRLQYLIDAFLIGSDNYLFGIGPGNYKEYAIANDYAVTIDPHNSYLQTYAELGILGFVLILFFYISSIMQSFFNARVDSIHVIIFILIIMLSADGMQSGLSLTMKIFYILVALTMRRGFDEKNKA
tara:strand:+ start:1126 stop:2310 length:1185 start_codon:yes stop_codon:yes gene_type:complete